MEIVNGYTGTENVTAAMDGNLYAGAFGRNCYVLDVGKKLDCTVASSNSVTIADGSLVMFGRHGYIKAGSTQTLSVTSGTTGYKRNDIVAAHYTANSSTGIEKIDLVVLKGTPTTGTPADPSYSSDSILSGSTDSYMPLWRLPLDGITIGTPVRLFTVSPSLASLGDSVSRKQTRLGNSLTCYVEGGICIVSADFLALPYSGTNVHIGSLPDGLRPLGHTDVEQTGDEEAAYIGALRYRGNDANFGQLVVTNSGSIMAYANVGGIENEYFYGQVIFPVTRS